MYEGLRLFALAGASLLALSAPSGASDWVAVRASELIRERSGSVAVTVGGVFETAGKSATGRLSAYCMDNVTVVSIEAKDLFLGTSPIGLTYQVDNGTIKAAKWDACTNGECVGIWNDRSIAFLQELFDKHELRIEIARSHQDTVRASFHVSGARTSLEALANSCDWKS